MSVNEAGPFPCCQKALKHDMHVCMNDVCMHTYIHTCVLLTCSAIARNAECGCEQRSSSLCSKPEFALALSLRSCGLWYFALRMQLKVLRSEKKQNCCCFSEEKRQRNSSLLRQKSQVRAHMHVHTYVCLCACMYHKQKQRYGSPLRRNSQTRAHMYLGTQNNVHMHTCMYAYMYIHIYIHTYIHTCMHTYTHTHMQVYKCTHMHTLTP